MGQIAVHVGDRFGKLEVIEKLPSATSTYRGHKSSHTRWLLRCDCGYVYAMTGVNFRRRRTPACKACAYAGRPQSQRRMSDAERLFKLSVQSPAQRRGLSVELTADDFVRIASQNCAYCGAAPEPRNFLNRANKHSPPRIALETHGLDRVDSTLGYTTSNCVSCCKQCNVMKMDLTLTEFLGRIYAIHDRLGLRDFHSVQQLAAELPERFATRLVDRR